MNIKRASMQLSLLVAIVVLLLVLCSSANAYDTNKWSAGGSGSWGTDSNWTLNLVPNSNHDVVVDFIDGNQIITYSTGTNSIHSLVSYEKIKITGGRLIVATDSVIHNFLELTSGELTAQGAFSMEGLVWTGGTLSGSGPFTLATGYSGNISGNSTKTLRSTLNNNGNLVWSGGSAVAGENGTVINNSELYDMQHNGNATAFSLVSGHSASAFNNSGTFRKSSGTGDTTIDWIFNNLAGASVEANTGNILFRKGGDIAGNYTGSGTSYLKTGTYNMIGALSSDNLVLDGATINGNGNSLSGNLFVWQNGTIAGPIDTSANIEISGSSAKTLIGVMNNSGTILWTGSNYLTGQNGTVINNGGLYDMQHNGNTTALAMASGHSSSTFSNSGTFRKSAGTGDTTIDWIFNNLAGASVEANTGSILFRKGGDIAGNYTGSGTTYLKTGTYNMIGALNSENIVLDGATLNGNDGSLSGSSFIWNTGTMTGTIDTSANMEIRGGSTKLLNGVMNNTGTILWTGTNYITGYNSTVLNNSGLYDLQHSGNATAFLFGSGYSSATFNNYSTFRKSSGTGNTEVSWIFNNLAGATVQTDTGSIHFTKGGNIQGDYTGAGTSSLDSNTFELVGALNSENVVLNGATLNGNGGSLSGSSFVWNTGTMTGTIDTSVNMEISGGSSKLLYGVMNNSAAILWAGGQFVTGYNVTALNNSGLYDIKHDGDASAFSMSSGHSGATFNNTGTFRKSSGTGSTSVDWIFNNLAGASVEANTGSIHFTKGGNIQGDYTGAGASYLDNGIFNLDGALNSENLILSGATLRGDGGSLSGSSFVWSAGTMTGTIDTSATMFINGSSGKYLENALNNSGTILWTGSKFVTGYNATVINNSGLYDMQHTGSLIALSLSSGYTGATFNNTGTFRKSSGADSTNVDWIFNNLAGASVEANTGSIHFTKGGNLDGDYTGAGNSYLDSGTFNLVGALNSENIVQSGATLKGSGGSLSGSSFVWNAGTMTGTIDTSATMFINGSSGKYLDDTLNNSGTILWSGSQFVTGYNATVINNSGLYDLQHTDNLIALSLSSGYTGATFNNTGTFRKSSGTDTSYVDWHFTNSGTIDAQTGTIDLRNGITNYASSVLTGGTYLVTGALKVKGANIVTNSGNIVLNGAASQFLDGANNDALANLATNTGGFTLNSRDFTTKGALANSGNVNIKNTSTLTVKGNYAQSAGETRLENGTLATDAGASVQIDGGMLTGNGTVVSDIFNSGEVSPGLSPGTINIIGNYNQSPTGLLTIELASLSNFDRLVISGDANLAGTLSINMLNGFAVSTGDEFVFLTCLNRSGRFDAENGLSVGPLNIFDVVYGSDNVKLVALTNYNTIPEPSSLLVLVSAVSGLAIFAKRRRG